jgi:hypothetical protein
MNFLVRLSTKETGSSGSRSTAMRASTPSAAATTGSTEGIVRNAPLRLATTEDPTAAAGAASRAARLGSSAIRSST